MKKIVTIGELLIDFIPNQKGLSIKDVDSYTKFPGGAPANVAVAARKQGIDTYFIGQVGNDGFGDFLIDEVKKQGVNTNYIVKSNKYNTSLAFVTLTNEGERDFIFYRNPGADQYYNKELLPREILDNTLLHFCSVGLDDYPLKESHIEAIEIVRSNNGFISFDPNLRFNLWNDLNKLKETVNEFISKADLLKISEDELEFITDDSNIESAINKLFIGNVKHIILTLGSKGSTYFNKEGLVIHVPSYKINVVDTTGAGDSFIGTFIGLLVNSDYNFSKENITKMLRISNATAALTTTKLGGMTSIPNKEEVIDFMK